MKHCKHCPVCTHLASALDRVTAENARLVQACEALLADRGAEALAERARIAAHALETQTQYAEMHDSYDEGAYDALNSIIHFIDLTARGAHLEDQ